MNIVFIYPIFLFSAYFLTAGNLVWKDTELVIPSDYGQKEVVALFHFENRSEDRVVIGKIQSSCGCTVPVLVKDVFEAGESGVIRAVFTVGDRVGPQRKTLRVQVSGSTEEIVVLTFSTTIPQLGEISPRMLLWRKGEEGVEKMLSIKIAPDVELKADIPSEDFPFVVREIESESPNKVVFGVTGPAEIGASKFEFNFLFSHGDSIEKKKVYLLLR
tara:strand:+ start:1614 stop:2261 length:648 start_codon:yes stop_codon:yes gene_type:complete